MVFSALVLKLLIANVVALLIPNLVSEWERVDPRPHLSSLLL